MSSETPAAAPLSNAQVRKLKGQAQRLEASVRLGRGGVSPTFLAGLDRELAQHELVKIRLYDLKDQHVQSEIGVTRSLIAVYKALGGGWETPNCE
jgi:RNA-binding protein YhbY